jgi:hypothetical protein
MILSGACGLLFIWKIEEVKIMNHNTRIAICCYNGDQHQVIKALDNYLQHGCPVVVLSPGDAPAEIRYPGIENRFAGKRAYIGQESLDRQREHLKLLLTFPEQFFLVHDADSVCLSANISGYLYEEPDVLWSNLVIDTIPEHVVAYPPGFPNVAFQPPYFLSRKTIEALLATAEGIQANPVMPFIDHYMVQLAVKAGWPYKGFPDGASCSTDPSLPCGIEILGKLVREQGFVFMHSIKRREVLDQLLRDRHAYITRDRS